LNSKLQRLSIIILAAIALGLFAVLIFPLLFMALVLVFGIRTLKRWRETDFEDEEFD
jgi:hypothetical protein